MRPLLIFLLCLTASPDLARAADDEAPGYPEHRDYPTLFAELDQARSRAIEEEKLLLVVMGADWCHDSRAFLAHLADPGLQELLEDRYTVQLVNVGFYDHVRGIVDRWDVPVIYGTPTVLVIEPVSDTLLNRDSHFFWRSADSLEPADGLAYFEAYAPGAPPQLAPPTGALAAALDQIDQFERMQAERIYLGYAELGALMRGLGDDRPGPEFMDKWDNLAAMRSQVTRDLASLRATAHSEAAAGVERIDLAWPRYELFVD